MRWTCLFLVACTPAATPVVAVGGVPAMRPAAATSDDPGVHPQTGDACTFKLDALHVAPHSAFCASSVCFAELEESIDEPSMLHVAVGPATTVALELETGAIRLRGSIRGADLLVAQKKATVIDGWIAPLALGTVKLRAGASSGDVEIEVKDSEELEFATPVVATRRCWEIGFEEPDEDGDVLEVLAAGAKRTNTTASTDANARLPISRAPGAPPVAFWKTTEETEVELVDTAQGMSRILVRTDRVAFIGWVPSPMVKMQAAGGHGLGTNTGFGRIGHVSGTVCPHDIPLFVRAGGKLVRVGDVVMEKPFDVETRDGRAIVGPRSNAFHLTGGMELEVMPVDLRSCED